MTLQKTTIAVSETKGEFADSEVFNLAQQIDIHSLLSIQEFGGEIAGRTAQYTDEILDKARSTDLEETGRQLNEIVLAAQEFDLESIGKKSGLGGIFRQFSRAKEKAIARFETVKAQVDKLVAHVESTAKTLDHRNQGYQSLYETVQNEYAQLGLHINAIELRLRDLESLLSKYPADAGDLESVERNAILEANRNALSKRADDLRVLQHSALQMMPMVRIIQSNNLELVDKFRTIRQLTLPAWKRAFLLALALDEQKDAVKLTDTIDNTTNALMERNAQLLHHNAVSTAKANQRLVVDVETLKKVHDKILLTLDDVRKAHQEGASQRGNAISELQRLRTEMTDKASALVGPNES